MSPTRSRPTRTRRPRTGRSVRRRLAAIAAVGAAAMLAVSAYYYVALSRQIDQRLHGERERILPRVFARPLELYPGQAVSRQHLFDRLNDLGYLERARATAPGEFSSADGAVTLIPRGGSHRGLAVSVTFRRPRPVRGGAGASPPGPIARLQAGGTAISRVTLEAPLLTAIVPSAREKRRQVPLSAIPTRVVQAVLAIEDRRFYSHPGVDPIRAAGALLTNLKGDLPYLVGGSTLTQQLVKNLFLTPEKSMRRKLTEQVMALILERRASKDEILELYLNEVYLGQRGSFAIHGVAEGARLFFGKDVNNVTLAEAATVAGVIRSPGTLSPFSAAERARERRNVVLAAMVDAGFVAPDAAARAADEPLAVQVRALDSQAPHFVDLVGETVSQRYPTLTARGEGLDVYTTLDLHLQRLAEDAVRAGLTRVDASLSRRRRAAGPAQAALISVDPQTGDVLAMVGGRSYNQSQFNRATHARRQPGSVFKPFVYLAAFQQARDLGVRNLTPSTILVDEPTTFLAEGKAWTPTNYGDEYDGPITLRRALAMSRNVATIKLAELVGYEQVAGMWRRIGVGAAPQGYPSIALGVFEATPYEMAQAYTAFANPGVVQPLRTILRLTHGASRLDVASEAPRRVASAEAAFLVSHMLRAVINEGTAASARGAGLPADAAGKTGTTNDLRDAWFVGFTHDLLTVVWVGFDENQKLGLTGAQAALPIWTSFMSRALAGQPQAPFETPPEIAFVEIDARTGALAPADCQGAVTEAFIRGTEPTAVAACETPAADGPSPVGEP